MMGEKIEVGEYIRTKNGQIDIFEETDENYMFARCKSKTYWRFDIVKHYKNKIDLIEIGDYANGEYVYELGNAENGDKWVHTLNGHLYYEKDIKIIWTKEQLKSIEYNVN